MELVPLQLKFLHGVYFNILDNSHFMPVKVYNPTFFCPPFFSSSQHEILHAQGVMEIGQSQSLKQCSLSFCRNKYGGTNKILNFS